MSIVSNYTSYTLTHHKLLGSGETPDGAAAAAATSHFATQSKSIEHLLERASTESAAASSGGPGAAQTRNSVRDKLESEGKLPNFDLVTGYNIPDNAPASSMAPPQKAPSRANPFTRVGARVSGGIDTLALADTNERNRRVKDLSSRTASYNPNTTHNLYEAELKAAENSVWWQKHYEPFSGVKRPEDKSTKTAMSKTLQRYYNGGDRSTDIRATAPPTITNLAK